MRLVSIALGAVALLFVQAAVADNHRIGKLMIADAYARASAGRAKAGAAYMTITNMGNDDRLVAARAEVSTRAELHGHIMDANGVARMRRVDGIDLGHGATVELKPGGLHVMFMGLKEPLKQGTRFPLTLIFDQAGEQTVEVEVRGVAAGASGKQMQHRQHGTMKTN